MSFSQIFLTALSLIAAGGGTLAIDKVIEGLSSPSDAGCELECARSHDEEADNRLNY